MINIFSGKYSIFLHILTWVGVFTLHFLALYVGYDISFTISIVDAFVFNTIFAALTIGLWHLVSHSDLLSKISFDQIITHVSSITIGILVWIFASTHILRLLFSEDQSYLNFLEQSFNIRLIIGLVLLKINILFFYLLKTIKQLRNQEEHEAQITKLLKDTELEALKSQINPHFLFNSLNSINALTRSNPEEASEMILQLSDYMRYSLNQKGDILTTVELEIDNLNKYLSIEKIRFGGKLNYSLETDERSLKMQIPPMLLQPLFENAIKHGLYSLTEGFYLNVSIASLEHILSITMTNNYDPNYPSKDRNGLGIKNVKNRLLNIFGRADLLKITATDDKGFFEVVINIPQNE